MVVVCEKCSTRFHLSDAKVPAKGARVRCSRCKHAFFIQPPGASREEAIEEVVSEATSAGGMPTPEVAQDLAGPPTEVAQPDPQPASASAPRLHAEERSPLDVEEDWEFNDDSPSQLSVAAEPQASAFDEFDVTAPDLGAELDPPGPTVHEVEEAEASAQAGMDTSSVKEPRIDPVESIRARDSGFDSLSSEDLGSPEEWDFVGAAETEAAPGPVHEETVPEPVSDSVEEESAARPAPAAAEERAAAPARAAGSTRLAVPARLASLGGVASWILVVLAFSVGLSAVFEQPSAQSARRAPVELAVSGVDLTASEMKARLIENALAGDLLVVSGSLENRSADALRPGRMIQVQLVSDEGLPIDGASAAAGRALPPASLREEDPDQLRRTLELSAADIARSPLRPGERIRFDAVFESVPDSAAGWVIEASTAPPSPDPGSPLPPAAPPAWE